jgi:NAD(P)-dependent dehydrogenase (short-subunit alcohol dehydrogenase family)
MTATARITTPFGFESTAAEVVEGIDLAGKRAIVTGGSSGIGVETARAGVMALPDLERTPDGWEMQFATNHLGHFALALGIHDALADAEGARIVSLSSRAHLRSPVVFDDIHFTSRPYDRWLAYGQSKTANALFAVEATRRWAGDGIATNAVHPGAIDATNLGRYMDAEAKERARASGLRFKTIEQGAATSVLVAISPQLDGVGGRYFEDCNEALVVDPSVYAEGGSGVAAYALDPESAERLWVESLRMVS